MAAKNNNGRKSSINEFTGGLNTDLHPLVVQSKQLTDALNAELVTTGDNQYIIRNSKGNLFDKNHGFALSKGFIPLAVKVYNNVAYIISGRFKDDGTFIEGELGTYPSPDYPEKIEESVTVKMVNKYAPLHNYLDASQLLPDNAWDEDIYHNSPFRTEKLNFNIKNFIDLTLQEDYDESINFIIADGENPVRLINSRFKTNKDGSVTIIDRRQKKDSNTYSDRYFRRTELLLTVRVAPTLEFKGVMSGGEVKGGGYRYYFRYINNESNSSDIIEESRLVSVHLGDGADAVGVEGTKSANKRVVFKLSNLKFGSGSIEVVFTHIYGDGQPVAKTFIINNRYPINEDGVCEIVHRGNEQVTEITETEINTAISSVSTAKTVEQINNRLVLGNISSTVDAELYAALERISSKFRIWHKYVDVETYGDPQEVYHKLGYWPGETYELGIVYILTGGGVTPAYPLRGLDNIDGLAKYSGDILQSADIEIQTDDRIISEREAFAKGLNKFENIRGLYRTPQRKIIRKDDGKRVALLLEVDTSLIKEKHDEDAILVRDNIAGYFIVRKTRNKDILLEGLMSRVAALPVGNVETVTADFDFIGFRRNTTIIYEEPNNYLGWADGGNRVKSSTKKSNLYDLDVAFVPQPLKSFTVIHPRGSAQYGPEGKLFNYAKAAFFSGDMEVAGKDVASFMQNKSMFVSFHKKPNALSDDDYERVHFLPKHLVADANVTEIRVDAQFVAAGTLTAADRQFTAQIDNSYSYISSSGIAESGKYKISGWWSSRNKRNVHKWEFLEYDRKGGNWYYIGVGKNDRDQVEDLFKVKKGDKLFIDAGNGRVFTIKWINSPYTAGNHIWGTYWVRRFGIEGDPTISRDWKSMQYYWQYNSADDLFFKAVKGTGTTWKAKGYNADATALDTSIWEEGAEGINKSAAWEKDESGDTFIYPYSSVINNYSSYVGIDIASDYTSRPEDDEEEDKSDVGFFPRQERPQSELFRTYIRNSKLRSVEDLRSIYSSDTYGSFYSVTERVCKERIGESVTVADGDCFVTTVFKQYTYAIGIPDAEAATEKDKYKYGIGPTSEYSEKGWKDSALSHELKDEGRSLIANGSIIELTGHTNHNCDVRSFEKADPTEKIIYGADRGFYPKVGARKLYTQYRPNSTAYNRGLTGDYRVVSYSALSASAPAISTEFTNRIMISAANTKSEFFNGYRDMGGLNFRDYNSELGQIVKLISFNNNLFCIFENGVALITVDGRTLINEKSDVYIDDAKVLASKATLLTTQVGSTNPESIISSYTTVYGVDYTRNKVWRIEGKNVKILSDYTVETLLNKYKHALLDPSENGIPKIYTSYDAAKKSVYFTYSLLKNNSYTYAPSGTVYYSELTNTWVSRLSVSPKYQLMRGIVNNAFDLTEYVNEAWESNVNTVYNNFYGKQYPFEIEFIMHGEVSVEKILTNLTILSNKVKPETITYTVTTDVNNATLRQNDIIYRDKDGNIVERPEDYTENTEMLQVSYVEDIKIREQGSDMYVGIFQENAYYKDGKYFIQVGKNDSFSRYSQSARRIRDKYFRIRVKYAGNDYTYIYAIISLFTVNYD